MFRDLINYIIESGCTIVVTDNRWFNDIIVINYIKHFNKYTKEKRVGEWRLLIYNGYGSYLTHKFITYCFENKIWLYALPPYSSHVLQPLNVVRLSAI